MWGRPGEVLQLQPGLHPFYKLGVLRFLFKRLGVCRPKKQFANQHFSPPEPGGVRRWVVPRALPRASSLQRASRSFSVEAVSPGRRWARCPAGGQNGRESRLFQGARGLPAAGCPWTWSTWRPGWRLIAPTCLVSEAPGVGGRRASASAPHVCWGTVDDFLSQNVTFSSVNRGGGVIVRPSERGSRLDEPRLSAWSPQSTTQALRERGVLGEGRPAEGKVLWESFHGMLSFAPPSGSICLSPNTHIPPCLLRKIPQNFLVHLFPPVMN